jgi:arsenate reductase-like glutaredoxin family protein
MAPLLRGRITMGAIIPEDHYPYERLTPEHVADIERMCDKQMRALRRHNDELTHEVYRNRIRLAQIERLLNEMGLDIDVMLQTEALFKEANNGKR